MNNVLLFFIVIVFSNHVVFASGQDVGHLGKWRIAPEWAGWFAPESRDMEIEFAADGRIVRTTGELVYTTKVIYTPQEHRVRLDETLLDNNEKPACSGKPAEDLMKHLKKSSYITLADDRLLYYRNENKNSLIMFMKI